MTALDSIDRVTAGDPTLRRLSAVVFEDFDPVVAAHGHRIRRLIDGRPDRNMPRMGSASAACTSVRVPLRETAATLVGQV